MQGHKKNAINDIINSAIHSYRSIELYPMIIIPKKEVPIKKNFIKEIFSFRIIKLNIRPKGTANCVPIIMGETKDEIFKAKYRLAYTPMPIINEKENSGIIKFF